ncbi:MAG: hypothetical protein FJ404_06610 [Verrucomicrobia bacterium]|nr:hypothetical protein [Verrucomicrobiota bacterium]
MGTVLLACSVAFGAEKHNGTVIPLPRAHAHNDYEHPRPLRDALDQGFCSVEADIFLVDGQLMVAHERAEIREGRTLQSLYLEPLRQRVQAGRGWVYSEKRSLSLLIDIKTEAESTYAALREVLKRYDDLLTRFEGTAVNTRAVTAIISGNRPIQTMSREPVRYAAVDGRVADLEGAWPPSLMPWISQSWPSLFKWRGEGAMEEAEARKLRELVDRVHAQGRLLRFWGLPDQPSVWKVLWEAGVDWINTDKLSELSVFMAARMKGL